MFYFNLSMDKYSSRLTTRIYKSKDPFCPFRTFPVKCIIENFREFALVYSINQCQKCIKNTFIIRDVCMVNTYVFGILLLKKNNF
ncbi:hypothetical protein BpHYR1_046623 [Brachionus plicatilis]|uniref:Uncharacterized protein n=1 Tax=Brachionus plicatilis TaxID=10195 RepID=A0A3M7Q6G5_BRAPC|nr:hypothetical protein BpHYR1_046623 [Brachionus plicatilis]